MALSYEQSSALMQDADFRGRIKVACLSFAHYVQGEAPNVPAHTSRYKWAQQCYLSPEAVAAMVQAPCVMQDAVQQAGASIDDASLQSAVETTIQSFI